MKNVPLLSVLFLLILSACQGLTVEKVDLKPVLEIAEDAQPSPVSFNKIRFAVPSGTPLISQSPKGVTGIITCAGPYGSDHGGISGRSFPNDDFRRIFLETLEGQGYDIAGDPGRMFDEEEDLMRSLYAVGARVIDIKTDICQKTSLLLARRRGLTGEALMTIQWSVFDLLNRKNVMKLETKGYATLKNPNYDGIALLLEEAFSAATHNLGATQSFHELIVYGTAPDEPPQTILDINEMPVALFDPQEVVDLGRLSLSEKLAKDRLEDIQKSVVMIQAGSSHGSGFFLTEEGHIMTNAHVVGNAVRVRVVTSGKKKKVPAEVLRLDRRRDVALLRLETVPEGLHIKTLPIRTEKVTVGEDVYAIGAPRVKRLQDTVTSGIVSAHRVERRTRLAFIQSDVDIYDGNSGGPLLDENGNIIGMSVKGFLVSAGTFGGLNWFVPIADALNKLDIQYSAHDSSE